MTIYSGDELYGDDITSGPIPEERRPRHGRSCSSNPEIGCECGLADWEADHAEETPIPEDFTDWYRESETEEARWSSIEDYDRMKDDRLTDEAERGRR